MQPDEFVQQLEDEKISQAIRLAEATTSGEIRVFVSGKQVPDALAAAKEKFVELGMTRTRERNGVLILVAPMTRGFAVVGDEAVHSKCGDEFWQKIADEMASHFRESRFTEGIVQGVRKAGAILAEHFPRRSDDTNELPDRVERD